MTIFVTVQALTESPTEQPLYSVESGPAEAQLNVDDIHLSPNYDEFSEYSKCLDSTLFSYSLSNNVQLTSY